MYQAWDAMFYDQMKHWEESWKYDSQRTIFSNKMILEGEIKDAKISSFSSDFQTLIKRKFPLYFFMNY